MTYPSNFDSPRNAPGSPRWTADRVRRINLAPCQLAIVPNIIDHVRQYERGREPITEDVVMCAPITEDVIL